VQLERLRLINFRQHEDTELVLGPGLTGIVGPNGVGKSTLLEAIAYALYGTPAARGSRETIRRRRAPPRSQVRVELDFLLGAHRYRIVRSLHDAQLFQDGDTAPIATSLNTVSEHAARLLGMRLDEFFNTYFTGQKELAVMAAMTPMQRGQFLSRVLGYERLKTAQDRLRERRSGLRSRLQALEAVLADAEELDQAEQRARSRHDAARAAEQAALAALAEAERRHAEIAPRWAALQQLRERMVALEGEVRLADHRVQEARQRFQGLDLQLAQATEARTHVADLRKKLAGYGGLRAERAALDGQAAAHLARQTALGEREALRRQLAALDTRLAQLPHGEVLDVARDEAERLRQTVADLAGQAEERRTTWDRDLQDARTKRETLLEQYKDLRDQHQRIVQAGRDGICPTCARPLGTEYENVLGLLDRQLQEVLFNGNYYKQRIEQLVTEPRDLVDLDHQRAERERQREEAVVRLGRLEAQAQQAPAILEERGRLSGRIAELEAMLGAELAAYNPARHREVQRQVAELEPLAVEAERYQVLAERAEALVQEAELAERELTDREVAARALRHELDTLGYSEELFHEARSSTEAAAAERREAELGVVRSRAEAGAAEESLREVARRRNERAVQEAEARRVAGELALHEELDRAFGDLRTDLNAQLRPDLSELASGFLRDLTNGRYADLELDENYLATIMDAGDTTPVISGGEEDLVNLALRLAISQMIAERAGQPLSLLVLDEIFGSLDEERRAAVLELLRHLADRFPQVIMITHIESVREGFDRVIRVDFDSERGTSVVRDEVVGGVDGLAA
jgi:exonuclease SbcC